MPCMSYVCTHTLTLHAILNIHKYTCMHALHIIRMYTHTHSHVILNIHKYTHTTYANTHTHARTHTQLQ